MPAAEARIPTPNAERYLTRLCQHAAKMGSSLHHRPRGHAGGDAPPEIRRAECSGGDGLLVLNGGQCILRASGDTLTLRAEAGSEDDLTRIQDLITARLRKFGHREHLAITWRSFLAPGGAGISGQE